MRVLARLAAVAGVLAGASLAAVAQPAWACGCGAMVSDSSVIVSDETSIVRYDERTRTEDIVMRLSIDSDTTDAAWLFPTPTKAQVKPGDRAWFEQLDRLTEPRVVTRSRWFGSGDDMAGAAPGSADGRVTVLGERRIGPFEVATLDAEDPSALAGWLRANGYRLSPKLGRALRPYVREGWKYVAVKLTPQGAGSLTGALDPLHVTFRTPELVYPMRLSRLATTDQALHLYVLAGHRVEQTSAIPLRKSFAGPVTPGQVASPGLKGFLGDGMYLTELIDRSIRPSSIEDDYRFAAADSDTPYRDVVYETDDVEILGLPAGWVIVIGVPMLLATAFTVVTLRRRPRRGVSPEARV
ncbi:MAG: DUF2330 domain-containing protein [Streptosporangiales bacterium]|nr:DUF2330 domain-containing protein [Streptosporangiales bacterium]